MEYAIIILVSYLIGTSSMSFYLAKLNNVDIRNHGSKNLGASNAMILMGWKAGILVGIHDIGKAFLAVYLMKYFFPDVLYVKEIAGVACVIGHIFPFYLKFKGGKGFASYVGMMFALNWKVGIVVGIAIILVTLITDYIVSGTITTIVSVPIILGFLNKSVTLAGILCIASLVIAYKHRENFVRMYNGTEIGFRSANRGEQRIK